MIPLAIRDPIGTGGLFSRSPSVPPPLIRGASKMVSRSTGRSSCFASSASGSSNGSFPASIPHCCRFCRDLAPFARSAPCHARNSKNFPASDRYTPASVVVVSMVIWICASLPHRVPDDPCRLMAHSTILTGGCAKKFTKEELLEVLTSCK